MSEKFDPYHQWLGIPPGEQPPHHYRLLGIAQFENDPGVIDNAANQRMSHLRTFQTGQHVGESQRLLNDVAAARVCLLNAERKSAYDESLRKRAASPKPVVRAKAEPLARVDSLKADPLDADLAAVFQTTLASSSSIASSIGAKGRTKKSQSKPTALIAVAAATLVALVSLGVWWAMSQGVGPNDGGIAKSGEPASSAKSLKDIAPKPSATLKTIAPLVASAEPKGDLKAGPPLTSQLSKPHEPKADFATNAAPTSSRPAEANLVAATDLPAALPESNDSKETKNEKDSGGTDSSDPQDAAKKAQPPSADEQKRVMAEIDEVYKPGAAKDQATKAALAHKLLDDGRKNEANRAEQFVMLRRAGEIACEAGEADLMLEAVDAIAAGFDIRPVLLKARLLKRLLEQGPPGGPAQLPAIYETCLKFAKEAAAGGAIDEASGVLDAAKKSVGKSIMPAQAALRIAKAALTRASTTSDIAERKKKAAEAQSDLDAIKSAQTALAECAKGLQQARREQEAIRAAQERLKTAPDDPAACLVIGQWYCFQRGDWDQGLKLLAKGSDPALKTMSAEELAAKPATATEKVARADAWWGLAEKAVGKSKLALQRRAGKWYAEALPDLSSGLAKTKVELRLSQVSKAQDSKEDIPERDSPAAASAARPLPANAPFDGKTAKTLQARWAKHLRVAVVETNSIGMKLTLIPPGEFEMGSSREVIEEEMKLTTTDHWYTDCLNGEGPPHRVRITKPFWMGTVPVTQEQYQRVTGTNPSNAHGDLQRPVDQVSCDAAMDFCRRLSEMPSETAAHRQYRLPSEAQWEYACRAGTTGLWFFSDLAKPKTREAQENLAAEYGWLGSRETRGVGQKRANPFGLYDMLGNVFEWCQDIYDPDYYANSPADDPMGPATSKATMTFHPLRGGSSYCSPKFGRSAYRFNHPGHLTRADVGFRVVATVAEKTGK